MARLDHDDASVVVIVGSGAGGGTLAHELTRRGITVVLFEAGGRQSAATFSQNPGTAFGQLTWLEPRTTSGSWGEAQGSPTMPPMRWSSAHSTPMRPPTPGPACC